MALPKVSGGTSASAHKLAHVHGSPITAAASEWNDTLATLDDKLSKYIGGNPVRLDGKPLACEGISVYVFISVIPVRPHVRRPSVPSSALSGHTVSEAGARTPAYAASQGTARV